MFVHWKREITRRPLWLAVMLLTSLLATNQQCSDVRLKAPVYETEFKSRGFPFRLYPPTDYEQIRRYVILVDMSKSMISGPCPFDVGNKPFFQTLTPYKPYDPNKDTGSDINDGRAAARGCYVDPELPTSPGGQIVPDPYQFGMQYGTFKGNDFEGARLDVVETWVTQLRRGLTARAQKNTQIMLVPVSGGVAQAHLDNLDPIKRRFVGLNDSTVDETLSFLRGESQRNIDLVLDQGKEGRWTELGMGTTAPGQVFSDVFIRMDEDMKHLNDLGLLSQATYKVIYLSDGLVTPIGQNIQDVLSINDDCDGQELPGYCSSLVSSMKRAWGEPSLNSMAALDLKLSLIQSLPKFYGSSLVELDLIQLQPERVAQADPDNTGVFSTLAEMAEDRHSHIGLWELSSSEPPFDLAAPESETKLFKMTNLFILNPNVRLDQNGQVRVDTDGDGLFDSEEISLQLDPHQSRTNGYCLDSLMARQSFAPRCRSFAYGSACDPQLDSDGDGLNQCEEIILGTDPFDFDTDGDSIPDFFEWMYGFNPLRSDRDLDTSGDGVPNLVNFAAGLGPKHYYGEVQADQRGSYAIDFMDIETIEDEELGQVMVELFHVQLKNILAAPMPALDLMSRDTLFLSRLNRDFTNVATVQIPERHQLLNCSVKPLTNRILVLARMVDESQPQLASWRIMKFHLSESSSGRGLQLDLSAFELMRVMDINYQSGGGR